MEITIIQSFTLKILGIAIALAAQIAPFSAATPEKSIYYWADFYHVSRSELYNTIKCESGFDPAVKGDKGLARGIAQIRSDYFPDITDAQAFDPDWSIEWMARQFAAGHEHWWTCYKSDAVDSVLARSAGRV